MNISMKTRIYETLSFPITSLFQKANRFNTNLAQRFNLVFQKKINSQGVSLKIHCPNMLTLWRAKTLETKEPETINWINSFKQEDVFYDIGANIGLYTLYAAKCKGCSVIAFEPESQNYALLNRNIYINNLSSSIQAFCIALSNQTGFDNLYLSEYQIGGAMHNLGEEMDYNHQQFISKYSQGVVSFSLDDIVNKNRLPAPTHIKIDVDGLEAKIIQGAYQTLKQSSVQSVLLELNASLECDRQVFGLMEELGFSQTNEYDHVHDYVADERFAKVKNYIFIKKK